jgi:uncharacterized protein (DUF2235 family)
MPQKIIFCADGTWCHPKSPSLVENADTNVYKLYKSLCYTPTQFTTYDNGVGADGGLFQHITGGAFGEGLFKKVKDGYSAIASSYKPGDAIYIFGFSRGAYTARCLAGMIANCGLPTKQFDPNLVETTFRAYRHKDQRAALLQTLGAYGLSDAPITCLGVWDTVGSLGIPVDPLGLDSKEYGFLDTSLHPDVQNAFHAISIDERRREFPPTLWTGQFAPHQTVEQVWFAGVHCDVGGGYNESGLSNITLSWMLKKAMACDPANKLELIDPNTPYLTASTQDATSTIHESWGILWGFPHNRDIPAQSSISNSVALRVAQDAKYRPAKLQLSGTNLASVYKPYPVV